MGASGSLPNGTPGNLPKGRSKGDGGGILVVEPVDAEIGVICAGLDYAGFSKYEV
jgi:hypothetical protein